MVASTVEVETALKAALDDPDYRIGAAALDQVMMPADTSLITVLLNVLHERQFASIQDDVRTGVLAWRAVCALGRIGNDSIVPHLIAAAEEEFTLLRASVISALVQIAIRSSDEPIRNLIVRYLIEQCTDRGVVSNFRPWHVCDEAAMGLQTLGIQSAICFS